MTDLHEIHLQITARISERPVGSASMFALFDASEALKRAIEAESREATAQTKEPA